MAFSTSKIVMNVHLSCGTCSAPPPVRREGIYVRVRGRSTTSWKKECKPAAAASTLPEDVKMTGGEKLCERWSVRVRVTAAAEPVRCCMSVWYEMRWVSNDSAGWPAARSSTRGVRESHTGAVPRRGFPPLPQKRAYSVEWYGGGKDRGRPVPELSFPVPAFPEHSHHWSAVRILDQCSINKIVSILSVT